ncbi:MAG: GldG family protein, partial [Anaerolineae bacterium]|nr:GldG family protein [Anaerolineae bacterium]
MAILAALPEKVEAIAFFSAYTPMDAADQLLLDFKANSNGKFDYQFVDPDLNPVEVREAGITGDGKILLQMREKQEIIPVASEQELLRGMLRLINPDERAVYFLTGHGEYDSEIQGERAVTRAIETLYGKNYIVQPLNLLAENAIPDDALTIVIVGATNPLSADEIALFDSYLADGGGLVALVDPTPLSELGNEEDTLVAYLAESWGVLLDDNLIVDPSSNPPSDAVAYSYAEHPITQKMNNVAAYFPFARSMQFVENKNLTQT